MFPAGVLISLMFVSDAHPGPRTHTTTPTTTTTMAIKEEICTERFSMKRCFLSECIK